MNRENPPPAELRPWVQCWWERIGDGGQPVRVVPDACIDIVWTEGAGTQVVGPNTTAFLVNLTPGTSVMGVRMRPGAAPPLLGFAAPELRDGRAPIGEVWGDDGHRLAEALDGGDAGALTSALLERARAASQPDELVRAAIDPLHEAPVAIVARELFVSERQLRRRVERAVGYGPKRLARVLRLMRALDQARAGDDLGRVAFDAGYADQAHFANDCRELAGAPPSVVLAA
jgi:AraC-like DNA-binding protein